MQDQQSVPVAIGIKRITITQAENIIDTKQPRGFFITVERGLFTGIRNQDGTPKVLAFRTEAKCRKWLEGKKSP